MINRTTQKTKKDEQHEPHQNAAGLAVPASCKIPTGVTHWGDQP